MLDNYQKIDHACYQSETYPDATSLVDVLLEDSPKPTGNPHSPLSQLETVYGDWYQHYIKNK